MGGIDEILKAGRAPAVHGVTSGNGSFRPTYDRVNPVEEAKWTAKKIEEAGGLTPDKEQKLKFLIESAERKEGADYSKIGRPLEQESTHDER